MMANCTLTVIFFKTSVASTDSALAVSFDFLGLAFVVNPDSRNVGQLQMHHINVFACSHPLETLGCHRCFRFSDLLFFLVACNRSHSHIFLTIQPRKVSFLTQCSVICAVHQISVQSGTCNSCESRSSTHACTSASVA